MKSPNPLTDYPVNVKLKLASLWTALMFLYIYADYFQLMTPGKLEDIMRLQTPVGPTSPVILVIFSGILIIPAFMIILSIFLKPTINRWLNIIFGFLYALISIFIVATVLGDEWQAFYMLFNMLEIVVLVMIIWQAWKWPNT